MMKHSKHAFSAGSGAYLEKSGLGLAMGLALLLGGCSGAERDYLNDLLQDLKPGGGHGGQYGPPAGDCDFVSWDEVYRAVQADLVSIVEDERPFQRYVTLANVVGSSRCRDTGDLLLAIGDTLDLTSRGPASGQPALIPGDTRTYRVDLRDFGWDSGSGSLSVGGTTFADPWEAVIDTSPFAVEFEGDNAESVKLLTSTTAPLLFGDAFVSVAARGPIFAALAGSGTSPQIASVLSDFDADVDIGTVAGDVLFREEELAGEVPRLDPALSGLDDGFRVDRDDWAGLYLNTLCILSVAQENRPLDAECIASGAL